MLRLIALPLLALPALPAQAHGIGGGLSEWPNTLVAVLVTTAWWLYPLGAVRARPRPAERLAFHTGMLVIGVALFGPVDEGAAGSTALHMVQHMMLMTVAAPLLVWARPLAQWHAVLGRPLLTVARPWLRSVRHPMAWAVAHALAVWGWHLPGPYMAAVFDERLHALEHASFLLTAWGLWWAVLRPPAVRRGEALSALLLTLMHTGFLGALLVFSPTPLYFGESRALDDQQLAGLIMWAPGGLAYLGAGAWCAWRWYVPRSAPTLPTIVPPHLPGRPP